MEKHDAILISCANAENRKNLRMVLKERYNLLETTNVAQLQLLLQQNRDCIAAIILVTSILDKKARKRLKQLENEDLWTIAPVIVITEEDTEEDSGIFFSCGAADVIPIHYDSYSMVRRIETLLELHLHKQHLEQVVKEQADTLRRSNDTMVSMLSSIIEYRSVESGNHILRIQYFTKLLLEEVMRRCPEYQLDARTIDLIASASALHDIGKIAVPDAVLLKPGPLSAEEWEIMKTHSLTGCQILESLGDMADKEYQRYAHNICHYHHERWDGGGYPEGLVGDQIPICAQVVGLADAYEALTSERVYKEAYSGNQAFNMILKGSCGEFSPKLLECFKGVETSYKKMAAETSKKKLSEISSLDMVLPPPEEKVEENNLERIWAKYYALVHYTGAFLIEVNLDTEAFHVVYNPYPNMVPLEGVTSLRHLVELLLEKVVVPEEKEDLRQLIYEQIPNFVDQGMRRSVHKFHYRLQDGEEGLFEMAILRIGGRSRRRSAAILFKKLPAGSKKHKEVFEPAENMCICLNDRDFTVVAMGHDISGLGGYSLEEVKEQFGGKLAEKIHPEDRKRVREELDRQFLESSVARVEHRIFRKDGSVMWIVNRSRLVEGKDGQEYLYCSYMDITGTREAYKALQERNGVYREILTLTRNVLFIWDVVTDTLSITETWKEVFPFVPPKEKIYEWLTQSSHIHPDDSPRLLDAVSRLQNGSNNEEVEIRMATDKGRYNWCRISSKASRDESGRLMRVVGIISNVDAEKQEARILKDKADQDSLTKLLNKAAGRKQIEDYLSHYPNGVDCTMLIIDLDNFKQVNDRYGHLFGDAVLTRVAKEIRRQFREQDIKCRVGGDEFMVLVRGTVSRTLLENRCRQFIDSLIIDLPGHNRKLDLSCSIGIALCPEHGKTYVDLFQHADQALYRAKAGGKNNFAFYENTEEEFPIQTPVVTAVSNWIDSDVEPGLANDNLVHQTFHRLYTARDVKKAVPEAIAFLGKKMNVSRVYIFENSDDNRFCSNTFEWCNYGIQPEMENLQGLSYETDIPDHPQVFDERGVFYCPNVTELPARSREILEPQGIKSMLHCAIRQDGVFRGYIGFDECVEQRLWSREEIDMLIYFSEMLSVFLLNYRQQEKLQKQTEELKKKTEELQALLEAQGV